MEFFFIVSGYLMMSSIEKRKCVRGGDNCVIGKETLHFLFKKIKSILPEAFVSWTIAFAFVVAVTPIDGIKGIIKKFIDGVWEFLILKMSGLSTGGVNGVVWYISSMLLCMAVLYPLIRRYSDVMLRIIIPLSMVVIFGWLCQEYGSPRNPSEWVGFTYKGNVRAFAEIELGILCYWVVARLKTYSFTNIGRCIITFIETTSYILVVLYMYTEEASKRDYFFIMLIAFGVICSFSEIGYLSHFFDSSFSYFLGKFSVPLYFSHVFYAGNLNKILPNEFTGIERMTVYLCCSFITAGIVMIFSKQIRKNILNWRKLLIK